MIFTFQKKAPPERTVPIHVQHETAGTNAKQPVDKTRTVPIERTQPSGVDQNTTITRPPQVNSSSGNANKKVGRERKVPTSMKPSSDETTSDKEQYPISKQPIPLGPPPESAPQNFPNEQEQTSTDDHREVAARKKIADVLNGIEELEKEVNSFEGTKEDKVFIRLEHELTNKLLRLDAVGAAGAPGENDIRLERKAAIKRVQQTLDILELKVMF